jgi:hypothetical protein
MTTIPLHDFVAGVAARNRITFGDMRRLRRDVLPDGIATRAEAEALIRLDAGLDAQGGRADPDWADWLVAAMVEFMVWGERPQGEVVGEAADWLDGVLAAAGKPTKAGRRIARAMRRERAEPAPADVDARHAAALPAALPNAGEAAAETPVAG